MAALATIATARTHAIAHSTSLKEALTSGYDRAFVTAAVVSLVALLVVFTIPRTRQVALERHPATNLQPSGAAAD